MLIVGAGAPSNTGAYVRPPAEIIAYSLDGR